MPSPKILEHIDGFRRAKGLTRAQLADLMGGSWSKETLDKVLSGNSCPRAETLAEIMEALKMPTFPASWFQSKKNGSDDE